MSALQKLECGIYTMCLVQDGDRVLLVNRPDKLGFPGYLGPGGKVDFPETITEGAVRELREETGLLVKEEDLIFKGMDGYVVPQTNYRYIVFNYLVKKIFKASCCKTRRRANWHGSILTKQQNCRCSLGSSAGFRYFSSPAHSRSPSSGMRMNSGLPKKK